MVKPFSLADHIKQLEYIGRAIGESIDDLRASLAGDVIYYNIDFGLLCPVLFKMPGAGSNSFLDPPADGMRRVLSKSKKEGHYELVISGPTIVEFFDQLDHTLRYLQGQRQMLDIPGKYLVDDERSLYDALFTSAELRDDLFQLTRRGLDQRVRDPINGLLALLKAETLRCTADVLDIEALRAETDKDQFRSFFEQHRARRTTHDKRSLEDSEFHYKIDAVNSCLTLAAARCDGPDALFVTPTPLNARQCTVGMHTYARLDRTPLFMLNTSRLYKDGTIGDELEFLEKAGREAIELVEELGTYKTLDACPNHLHLRVVKFYQVYVPFLSKSDRADVKAQVSDIEEIVESIRNKNRVREVLDEAVRDLQDGAKRVERYASELDLSFIDEFDFENDPILNRMRERLGILAV